MSDQVPSPETVAKRVIALSGGREAFLAHSNAQIADLNAKWDQDSALMGRILRAHVFVEYYLGRYIQRRNPNLGDLDRARLGFAQKIDLVSVADTSVYYLLPGIRCLNKVRNRLAHNLAATITNEDRDVFLSVELFRALRDALAAPSVPSDAPIDVLESFAQHAGMAFNAASDPHGGYWIDSMR